MITMTHERHLIGTAIASNGACLPDLIAIGVEDHHFNSPEHRALWRLISDRYDQGEPIEARFLNQAIRLTSDPRKYGPASLVDELAQWSTQHTEHEARELIGHYTIRQIREHGHRCAKAASSSIPEGRAYQYAQGLLGKVESDVGNLDTTPCSREESGSEMAETFHADLVASLNPEATTRPMTTGIDGLDQFWRSEGDTSSPSGLVDEEFGCIAARPGEGKTALAENLCISVAEQGNGAAIISCDMGAQQLRGRLISKVAYRIAEPSDPFVPVGMLSSRQTMAGLSSKQRRIAGMAARQLSELPLHITRLPRPGIREIRSYARRLANKLKRGENPTPLKLIVIDYLDKIKGDHREGDRRLQIGVICNQLKDLAEELKCTVVVLVQLNRSTELNPGGRPEERNLKESGDIEQAADFIWLLWRQGKRDELKRKDEITVLCPKVRRSSPNQDTTLFWHGPTGSIEDPPYRATYGQKDNVARLPDPRDRESREAGWTD